VAQHAVSNSKAGIALIARNSGIFAPNLDAATAPGFDPDEIVNGERLVNRFKSMETIGSQRANRQSDINFCKRAKSNSHVLILPVRSVSQTQTLLRVASGEKISVTLFFRKCLITFA